MRQDELGFFRFVPSFFCITERITKMHLWARLAPSRMASLFLGLLGLLSSLNNVFLRMLFKWYFLLSSYVSTSFCLLFCACTYIQSWLQYKFWQMSLLPSGRGLFPQALFWMTLFDITGAYCSIPFEMFSCGISCCHTSRTV